MLPTPLRRAPRRPRDSPDKMPSNVPGYLLPSSGPLEGQALLRFIQQWVVGITGLDGTLVRPRWQPEPPNIPTAGEAWAAVGIALRPADSYAYASSRPDGSWLVQRHELLHVLASFYDLGYGGLADEYASRLREGAQVPQNLEPLLAAQMGLGWTGDLTAVPSLLKKRWLYRVDLPVVIRRCIERIYPVLSLASAEGTLRVTDAPVKKIGPVVVP